MNLLLYRASPQFFESVRKFRFEWTRITSLITDCFETVSQYKVDLEIDVDHLVFIHDLFTFLGISLDHRRWISVNWDSSQILEGELRDLVKILLFEEKFGEDIEKFDFPMTLEFAKFLGEFK